MGKYRNIHAACMWWILMNWGVLYKYGFDCCRNCCKVGKGMHYDVYDRLRILKLYFQHLQHCFIGFHCKDDEGIAKPLIIKIWYENREREVNSDIEEYFLWQTMISHGKGLFLKKKFHNPLAIFEERDKYWAKEIKNIVCRGNLKLMVDRLSIITQPSSGIKNWTS